MYVTDLCLATARDPVMEPGYDSIYVQCIFHQQLALGD